MSIQMFNCFSMQRQFVGNLKARFHFQQYLQGSRHGEALAKANLQDNFLICSRHHRYRYI